MSRRTQKKHYLRAISLCWLKDRARRVARELEGECAAGLWTGGNGIVHMESCTAD